MSSILKLITYFLNVSLLMVLPNILVGAIFAINYQTMDPLVIMYGNPSEMMPFIGFLTTTLTILAVLGYTIGVLIHDDDELINLIIDFRKK